MMQSTWLPSGIAFHLGNMSSFPLQELLGNFRGGKQPFTGTLCGTQPKRSISLADTVPPLVHSLIALYTNTQIRNGYTAIINCNVPAVES